MFGSSAERMPFLVVEDRNNAPLVFTLRSVYSVRDCVWVAISLRVVNSSVCLSVEQHRCDELNARLILREIDVLPFAGTAPEIECRQHCDQTETYGDKIDIRAKQEHRRLIFTIAGQMCEPAHRGQLRSKPALSGTPAGLTLIAGTEHDDVRFDFAQRVVFQPEPRHHALGKVLDHDFRLRTELTRQHASL